LEGRGLSRVGLDRVPRAARLAVAKFETSPALDHIVKLRLENSLAVDGALDFTQFARAYELGLRVLLFVDGLGEVGWAAGATDDAVVAAAKFLHDSSVSPSALGERAASWLLDAARDPAGRSALDLLETPDGLETAEVMRVATWVSARAALVELVLTALLLREIAELARPGDFWPTSLIQRPETSCMRYDHAFESFEEAWDATVVRTCTDGWMVTERTITTDAALEIRCVWMGMPFMDEWKMPLEMLDAQYDVAAFVPQTALFLASNLGATVREAARFADCPRVTDCVVRFVGLGLAAEATTPVATALRVDIQDDATAELIGRKDKTFFDDVERRGIKVVVLSGRDSDGATTEE